VPPTPPIFVAVSLPAARRNAPAPVLIAANRAIFQVSRFRRPSMVRPRSINLIGSAPSGKPCAYILALEGASPFAMFSSRHKNSLAHHKAARARWRKF